MCQDVAEHASGRVSSVIILYIFNIHRTAITVNTAKQNELIVSFRGISENERLSRAHCNFKL